MLFVNGALGLVLFALWVFCLIDVITTDASLCRNLPKNYWILIVLLLFDVGAVIWLVAGRTWPEGSFGQRPSGPPSAFPEYERPGRFAATSSADDEEFLRRCRERAEQQRQAYQERQRRQAEGDED